MTYPDDKIMHGQYALLVSHTPGDVARGVSQKKPYDRVLDLDRTDARQDGRDDHRLRAGQRDRGLNPGPKERGSSLGGDSLREGDET